MSQATPITKKTRNAEATRCAILEAGLALFIEESYDEVGVRAIATKAGVDAALICRYFGSKKGLFAEVLNSLGESPVDMIHGDVESFGKRAANIVLDPEQKTHKHCDFISIITRSCNSSEAGKLVQEHMETHFIRIFCDWLGGDKAEEKAWQIVSILISYLLMENIQPEHTIDEDRFSGLLQSVIDY